MSADPLLCFCIVWCAMTPSMVWATSVDPTTGKATKDGLWCKWGKSNGIVYIGNSYLSISQLALLYQKEKYITCMKIWTLRCDQNNGGGWRSLGSRPCLLTTKLANKPQPSLGHAASLCDEHHLVMSNCQSIVIKLMNFLTLVITTQNSNSLNQMSWYWCKKVKSCKTN